jgi:hypothetical protein
MPSRLLNRVYQVQWSDFHMQPPPNANLDAHIETKAELHFAFSTGPNGVRLADSVTVTIKLLHNLSWAKKQRINSWSKQAREDLLRHEQGHYDITALMGRDMFLDIMPLKSQSFAGVAALNTAIQTIAQRYNPQPIHTKYDSLHETNHGRTPSLQLAWDGYIRTGFTQARSPAVYAANGAAIKVRLLDVLRQASKI